MTIFSMLRKSQKSSENPENTGKIWHRKVRKNYDKSIIHLPRQQVTFMKKVSKIKGCGSLREDFYTRFIPGN